MNETESNLTPASDLPYLSDVLELDQFKQGQANIIVAPCHSGKTTAAKKIIDTFAHFPERALILIDTAAGKQSLITHSGASAYSRNSLYEVRSANYWGGAINAQPRTMTYHHFGWELPRYPEFTRDLDVIICDEMHNLMRFIGIERSKNEKYELVGTDQEVIACQTALQTLSQAASNPHAPLIVVMTATVNAVSKALDQKHVPVQYFNYYEKCTAT